MKKFYLSIILCFCSLFWATAQNNESSTTDVTDSSNFKQWSIEFGGGMSIAPGIQYRGLKGGGVNNYFSSTTKGHRFWNPGANIGARYMFNNLAGIKANVGFIDFYNKKGQKPYDTKQFELYLAGVISLGKILHMEEFAERFNFLAYGGAGLTLNTFNKGTDKTVFFIGGLTTQYMITKSLALQLDLSVRPHLMYNYSLNNVPIGAKPGFIGNASLGLAVYLGGASKKEAKHADWYYIKRDVSAPAYVPTTPEELLVDTDGDGVPDYLDLCPSEPGSKELHGCPDRDGDGVADYLDRCPDTPGLKEFQGCPEEMLTLSAKNIQSLAGQESNTIVYFDFNKNNIKLSDYHTLYKFIYSVKDKSGYKVIVEGHADETGSEAYNLKLSEKRANAVKKFLVREGLNEENISIEAYGKTKPRANNRTSTGRSENRRSEIKIVE